MRDNNINTILANSLQVKKDILSKNIKPIIHQIKIALEKNEEAIHQANEMDKKNHNGFILDFHTIQHIFTNLEKETLFYGDIILSQRDKENNILYGTQIMDRGNVVVITDGNPYTILEMAIRNMMAGNTTIFANDGFMLGTNQLLIQIIQSVLEQFKLSKYFIQIYISENFDEVLSNFANINLVVCIGDHDLQRLILNKSKNQTIVSGYENFDLYIEDSSHLDFIDEIINTGLNIQLYKNDNIQIEYPNAILVNDIEEAIAQINYNGSGYSSAIFTSSNEHAAKFIREVKSKIITINTSPTIERILDIKQTDLIREKTIIYPFNFKIDGTVEMIIDNDVKND